MDGGQAPLTNLVPGSFLEVGTLEHFPEMSQMCLGKLDNIIHDLENVTREIA